MPKTNYEVAQDRFQRYEISPTLANDIRRHKDYIREIIILPGDHEEMLELYNRVAASGTGHTYRFTQNVTVYPVELRVADQGFIIEHFGWFYRLPGNGAFILNDKWGNLSALPDDLWADAENRRQKNETILFFLYTDTIAALKRAAKENLNQKLTAKDTRKINERMSELARDIPIRILYYTCEQEAREYPKSVLPRWQEGEKAVWLDDNPPWKQERARKFDEHLKATRLLKSAGSGALCDPEDIQKALDALDPLEVFEFHKEVALRYPETVGVKWEEGRAEFLEIQRSQKD